MSILIVGGNGYVGSTLARALAPEHTVHCTFQSQYTPIPGVTYHLLNEIADKDRCRMIASKCVPDVIIYAAGTNDPGLYESDQFKAQIVFSGGPGAMIAATEVMKSKFILLSSDFVFAGNEGNYAEADTPLSFSQFGKAKVGGENFIKQRSMNHIIIRSAPLMGRGPIDHPSWIDQWRETLFLGKTLSVPGKKFHNPVVIGQLVDTIKYVINTNMKNKTLHIGGLSKVSMFEMATLFATQFGFNTELIKASDENTSAYFDYSLNFSETLKALQTEPLFLEQCLNLI